MDVKEYKKALDDCANLSVIVQLTDKCVLSCKYCFARGAHHGDNPRFPDDLLEQRVKILNKCLDNSCRFAFLCNGGCPYLSYIASGGMNVSEKDCTCEGKSMVMEYIESVRNALILEEISLQSKP